MSVRLLHTAYDFKKNEVDTLKYINARGFFDADFSELATAIKTTHERYVNFKKNMDFNFFADFNIEMEEKNHRVVLNAAVEGEYMFTTYSLGICGNDDTTELIRRFHFDYLHNNATVNPKSPVSHLQYGGSSGGVGYSGIEYGTNNLENWLSEPRLNCPPMNIALLLDIVFCEFYNEGSYKIIEDSDWRALIKKNEVFALKQYYKFISDHIDSVRHTKEKLARDIFYGGSNR